ncbi:MAG: hypothetical protein WC867_06850 [Candidatus Pacearchaeota archaeon]|jgi:hypothetical protein
MKIGKKGEDRSLVGTLIALIIVLVVVVVIILGIVYFGVWNKIRDLPFFSRNNSTNLPDPLEEGPPITCPIGEIPIVKSFDLDIKQKESWKCTCNSFGTREDSNSMIYSQYGANSKKPWASFEPPCKPYNKIEEGKGIEKYPVDSSVDYRKIKGMPSESDKGFCLMYYSTRALNDGLIKMTKNELKEEALYYDENKISIKELSKYKINEEGYIEKIYKVVGERTRLECINFVSRNFPYYYYGIFYNDSLNNLKEGNPDDRGYCVGFPIDKNKVEVLTIFENKPREECSFFAKDDSSYNKYSFFIDKLGEGKSVFTKDNLIVINYSSDYLSKKRGESLTETEIKSKCLIWEKYDLIFITGVKDPRGKYYGESEARRRSACVAEINYLKVNGILEEVYDLGLKDTLELNDGERICCYANKI